MSQESADCESSQEDGPPARNLRKNSGRHQVLEIAMPQASDKAGSKRGVKGRTKAANATPSVKAFFSDNKPQEESSEEDMEGRGEEKDEWAQSDEWFQSDPTWNEPAIEGDKHDQNKNGENEQIDFEALTIEEMRSMLKEMHVMLLQLTQAVADKKKDEQVSKRTLTAVNDRLKLISKAIVNHDKTIQTTEKKMDQARSMKANIIILGIKEKKAENCKEVAKTFFKEKLKITQDVEIAVAHHLGNKEMDNRRLIVRLKDPGDKALIYKHAKNLKDLKSKINDEGYYINDQLPDVQEEKKRLQKAKVKINRNLIPVQQQNLDWKKGQLLVDGEVYEPNIVEPNVAEILEMDSNSLRKVLAHKLFRGEEVSEQSSIFTGYPAKVHTMQDVAECYRQLKYDGEFGAGRRLLMYMVENSTENTAVFVIRYHKGPNIGLVRFAMYVDAAKSTIKGMPTTVSGMISKRKPGNFSLFANKPTPITMSNHGRDGQRVRGASVAAKKLTYTSKVTPVRLIEV